MKDSIDNTNMKLDSILDLMPREGDEAAGEMAYREMAYGEMVNDERIDRKGMESKRLIISSVRVWRYVAAVAAVALLCWGTWAFFHTSETVLLNSEKGVIAYHEIVVPVGQHSFVCLPDGTQVWINANTVLRYPESFDEEERRVSLRGEAFFDVARDESKPFIVSAAGREIKVLGTHFNVSAYEGNSFITSLIEGSVLVSGDDMEPIRLRPMQEVRAENGEGPRLAAIMNKNFMLWREGYYAFDNMEFTSILAKLESYYDVHFQVENANLVGRHFTAKFRQDDMLSQLLAAMQRIMAFDYEQTEEGIIIIK